MADSTRLPAALPRLLAALPILAASGSPAAAQVAPPMLAPGATHRFPAANGLVTHDAAPALVERSAVGSPPLFALWNGDAAQDPGTHLRATSVAHSALSRSKVVVTVQNDFDVAPGIAGGEPIAAQISTTIEARGFLLLFGAGKARGKVTLKILDVTGKEPYVIDSHEILKEELEGSLKPTIGVEAGALLPVPDGEAGVSLEFETDGAKKLIADSCDVGRLVLLQRGHRYRILLELETLARTDVVGGVADAEFWMLSAQDRQQQGLEAAPSLLQRAHWRRPLSSIAGLLSLSRIDDSRMIGYMQRVTSSFLGEEGQPRLAPLLSRDTISIRALTLGADETISSVLRDIGLPGSLDVAAFVDWLPEPPAQPDDLHESLGVSMRSLAVTLAPDTSATDRRDLEQSLANAEVLVSLYLPLSAGGRLEEILLLLGELIAGSRAAGIETGRAATDLDAAVQFHASGAYKRSYLQACRAYRRLVSSAR